MKKRIRWKGNAVVSQVCTKGAQRTQSNLSVCFLKSRFVEAERDNLITVLDEWALDDTCFFLHQRNRC